MSAGADATVGSPTPATPRRARLRRELAGLLALALATASCAFHEQSMLHPGGIQAARIERLWWTFFWICAVVWIAVVAALLVGLFHRGPRYREGERPPERERTLLRNVGAATMVTVVLLLGLLVGSVATGHSLTTLARPSALVVEITGRQWWWAVTYVDPVPGRRVDTANELHIPVGRPVLLELASPDVIHSLWIPNLHGKRDLIPGYRTRLWIEADRPGAYRAECAEFCGEQHAHMALWVIAEPPERFAGWLGAQAQQAATPTTSTLWRGRQLFEQKACSNCHTIRGTQASGKVAPDLTHLASRRTLAAGTWPNTRGHLAAWIADPQGPKPGNSMPAVDLSGDELQAIVAYLGSLK